mmetsp:Transcript_17545/g.57228  ORF Transcript_17545/g.57228 Transcript_17545/m.57228 type:complete len:131 (+) Transcript_17545:162-554(+)
MAAAQPTVILRQKKTDDGTQKKQAPLKLSLPASWIDAPCLKLLDTWGKRKKLRSEALCLEAGDGTPIPEEWPIEAALMLYGEEDDDDDESSSEDEPPVAPPPKKKSKPAAPPPAPPAKKGGKKKGKKGKN